MPSRWTFHTLMLAVLLTAFGLTLGGLTLDGIWWDEVFSWNYSTGPFTNTLETRTDVHPPLYYMTLWLWNAWTGSQNIWMMRMSSVWMGLLSVALVYRLGWAWFERGWVALTAAVWLGTHSVMIYQLRDIRMYPLVVLLTLVSWWALWRLLQGRRFGVLGYGVSVALMAYTYYFTVFAVLAQALYVLIAHPRRIMRTGIAYVIALGLFAPWLPIAYRQIQTEAGITEGAAEIPLIGAVGKAYTARVTDWQTITDFLTLYSAEQISLLVGLVVAGSIVGLMQARKSALAAVMWGVGTVVLFLGVNAVVPLFTPRYAIMILPGVALLVGLVTLAVQPRFRPLIAALIAVSGIVAHNHGYHYLPSRDPHREILHTVVPQLQPEDRIWYAFTFGALGSATYGEMSYYTSVTYPQLTDDRFVWNAADELTDAEVVPRVWDVRYLYNPMPPDVEATITDERVLTFATRQGEYMVRRYDALPETDPAQFGDVFSVYPMDWTGTAQPGETIDVDMLVRPLTAPMLDYSYGLHLRRDGVTVAQTDNGLTYTTIDVTPEAAAQQDNALPTSAWRVWDSYRVVHLSITLPNDLPAGSYDVYLTLYYWETPLETPLSAPDTMQSVENLLYVGNLQVE